MVEIFKKMVDVECKNVAITKVANSLERFVGEMNIAFSARAVILGDAAICQNTVIDFEPLEFTLIKRAEKASIVTINVGVSS